MGKVELFVSYDFVVGFDGWFMTVGGCRWLVWLHFLGCEEQNRSLVCA